MIKITKSELKDKLIYLTQELGLTNVEIAERLNSDFEADDKSKLNAIGVAKLKKQLDIKGLKPKKKALFEFIEEESNDIDVTKSKEVELHIAPVENQVVTTL